MPKKGADAGRQRRQHHHHTGPEDPGPGHPAPTGAVMKGSAMATLETPISGNLTRDPELNTKGNTPRTTLSIASTFGRGTDKERTEYTDVFVFGELAENAVKSLRKGSMVDVVARISSYKQDVVIDGEEKSITRHRFTANQVAANLRFATAEISKVARSGGSSAPAAKASEEFEEEAETEAPKAPAKRPAPAKKPAARQADPDFDF